ncbi:MAG: aldo/keto reductase [bacterium]|nr:aldo/keto reductase [bacterium]
MGRSVPGQGKITMEYRNLGNSGIKISFLSMGTLTMSPMQKDIAPDKAGELMRKAFSEGINYFDSAEIYRTYKHIKASGLPAEALIGSKSYAVTYEEMRESIEKARRETDRDIIDMFMLHQQESALTLKGHHGAIEYMAEAKRRGIIRAAGISTHNIAGVRGAAELEELDFIFAIFNYMGLGILDGTKEEMAEALEYAASKGKGILIMKGLGGGHCFREPEKAFDFLRQYPWISSVVIGMQNEDEIKANLSLISGKPLPNELSRRIFERKRYLNVEHEGCLKCGTCASRCDQHAITLGENGISVDHSKCILCGYCASVCPEFCLEVV